MLIRSLICCASDGWKEWVTVLLLMAAGSVALPAHAADPRFPSLEALLDTPISGASKRPQRPADAPSMTSTVTAGEIRAFGWRTLAEALAALRGVHVSYDRSYSYLGLRGFGRPGDYNSRVLLLLDGVPINDGLYDQAMVGGEFPLDLSLVERIEYVPGPGSVLYGGNAFFGVINVVTASGAQRGREIEIGAGSGRAWSARATAGGRGKAGADWLLSATRERRRGEDLFFESYAAPGANAWSHGLDHESNDRLYGRFSLGGFSLDALFHDRIKGYPGGAYGVDLDDPRSRQSDRRAQLAAHYEHPLDLNWQLALHGYLAEYAYVGRYSTGGVLERESANNRYAGGEARLIGAAGGGHTVVFGIAWREDSERRQVTPSQVSNSPKSSRGVFAQDDWLISDVWSLSAGIRHDRDSHGHRHTSPRLALIARPGAGTQLKLISGSAYRDPNGYESDYAYAGANIANPALKGERIRSDEVGIEHAINGVNLSASLYRNRIDDLIALETDPVSLLQQHHNVGTAVARGLEIEARAILGNVGLRGSMAWQSVRHESGVAIANAPRRLAKVMASMPLPGGLGFGWETHYIGPRRADSGDVRIEGAAVGGAAVSHLTIGAGIGPGFDWQLRVGNVFDRTYVSVVGAEFSTAYPGVMVAPMPTIIQDGRNVFCRLRWKL